MSLPQLSNSSPGRFSMRLEPDRRGPPRSVLVRSSALSVAHRRHIEIPRYVGG
jgi:hypothetical protein